MVALVSSGSSGNMPTGSGSERLRRASVYQLNNGSQEILSGVAGHIYTVISIIFQDQQSAAGTLRIYANSGSNNIYLLKNQAHAADATFVFSDRFVLEEDDDLDVWNSVTDGNWWISYIDQDWT